MNCEKLNSRTETMIAGEKIAVKICGMREADNIMDVASLNPEYLGFIFYAPSPRYVGDDFQIPSNIPDSVRRVGVFVNEDSKTILEKARLHNFDLIQLHGNETPEQAGELRATGLKIIKVFSVDDTFNFRITKPYVEMADYFLFDTKGKNYGGNATTFNWEILKHYDQEVPFFLSGGLSPENVTDISSLEGMNLHAVDVNSGVEDSPGKKNITKIKLLMAELYEK